MIRSRKASGKYFSVLASLVVFVFLAACSNASRPDLKSALASAKPLISEQTERRLGAAEHPKILALFGGAYTDPKLESGLSNIVDKLARVSDRPDITYQVTILNSPQVNAFALPGGFLYVTRGLLALANDEDELVAVLAHEMAHVTSRHAAKRESQAISAVLLGKSVQDIVSRPTSLGSAMSERRKLLASFSRQQELEADEIGLETAVKAGYDPFGAASFLDTMGKDTDLSRRRFKQARNAHTTDFLATHPATPDRISRVIKLSNLFGFERKTRKRKRTAYLNLIDGMLFGDDPIQGLVRGQEFIHSKLKIKFSVPDNLTLQNSQHAVFALGNGNIFMRFDSENVRSSKSLKDYIRNNWGKGIEFTSVTDHTVNSKTAAFARAKNGNLYYSLAAIRTSSNRVYRFLFISTKDSEELRTSFDKTVASFKTLTNAEAARIKPQRIRTRKVRRGDTVASLSKASKGSYDYERFLIMNGMGSVRDLRTGQIVKVIAQ